MIILTNTGSGSDTLTLQAITASSALTCHASYVDNAGGSIFTPGRTNTIFAAAGTMTVVPAPATGSYRTVKTLSVYNSSATVSCQLQVNHVTTIAGQQNVALLTITLLPGYCCQYNEGMGFETIGADGQNKVTIQKGRLLKTSILTYAGAAATPTFTCGPNTNTLKIRGCGGGGGGGPTTSVASAAGAGGGGGAGGSLEWVVAVTPNLQCTYTVGAGGASGASGTASTFVVSGVTATASFGLLGATGTGTVTVTVHAGGGCNAQSTNGTVNGKGAPGGYGVVPLVGAGTTEIVASGRGGSSSFDLFGGGGGGVGITGAGNGIAGTGYGAGGSGATCGASTANTGGPGTNGVWIVEEYS